ncbi:DUF3426 domain-containing protein [Massilia sp. ST3]|uniref:DUF3426 domain-containing protein n=1 Tax=Massilia sp. ST3 TaxID=2824903 RepID=UPI001B824D4F|nr:DUF3426 domain-containing protein [Massilia sp. ST3]MBQ5949072.1 DUF3426 domain-containing protein [Massilia sp. ST3]
MALATQCPHCGTMFRVAADQLKLRGGIVRCGACQQVFDGNKGLVDLSANPPVAPAAPVPPAPVLPAPSFADEPAAEPAPAPAVEADEQPAPAAEAQAGDEDGVPIYTLEFDRTFSPFGIIPRVSEDAGAQAEPALQAQVQPERETPLGEMLREEPAPPESGSEPAPPAMPAAAAEPGAQAAADTGDTAVLDLPVDEELVAAPPPDAHEEAPQKALEAPLEASRPRRRVPAPDAPPMLLRESSGGQAGIMPPPPPPKTPRARAAESRARRSKLTPTKIEPPKLRVPESDEPEFVRRGRQREQSSKAVRIAMALGSALLLLALAAQAVHAFRDTLAARYPGMRPALVSACGLLACRVGLPAQIDKLVIETGELTTLGGNAYSYTTLLRNEGALVQAWPSIELTLNDADDKPLVRRVFGPRDYLPATVQQAAGIAARAEQPVRLHFRLEGLEPSGYHIAVFYP